MSRHEHLKDLVKTANRISALCGSAEATARQPGGPPSASRLLLQGELVISLEYQLPPERVRTVKSVLQRSTERMRKGIEKAYTDACSKWRTLDVPIAGSSAPRDLADIFEAEYTRQLKEAQAVVDKRMAANVRRGTITGDRAPRHSGSFPVVCLQVTTSP